jgi:hypothetical protein
MRNEIEDWTTIAGHDNGLAIVDFTGEFAQPVLCIPDRNCLHAATSSMNGWQQKMPAVSGGHYGFDLCSSSYLHAPQKRWMRLQASSRRASEVA